MIKKLRLIRNNLDCIQNILTFKICVKLSLKLL